MVSLLVLAALLLLSRVLPDRIIAVTWFSSGPDAETARVDKGHDHLIFSFKASELF